MRSNVLRSSTIGGLIIGVSLINFTPATTVRQQPKTVCADPAKSTVTCESGQMAKCETEIIPDPNDPKSDSKKSYRVKGSCTNLTAELDRYNLDAWILSNVLGKQVTQVELTRKDYVAALEAGKLETNDKVITFTPINDFLDDIYFYRAGKPCLLCISKKASDQEKCQDYIQGSLISREIARRELCGSNRNCGTYSTCVGGPE